MKKAQYNYLRFLERVVVFKIGSIVIVRIRELYFCFGFCLLKGRLNLEIQVPEGVRGEGDDDD